MHVPLYVMRLIEEVIAEAKKMEGDKSGDRTIVNPLDEFLFSQSSHCWALLTKDAYE